MRGLTFRLERECRLELIATETVEVREHREKTGKDVPTLRQRNIYTSKISLLKESDDFSTLVHVDNT